MISGQLPEASRIPHSASGIAHRASRIPHPRIPLNYTERMINPTVSLKHVNLAREEACGICGAAFVPGEDSGSRVLTIRAGEDTFAALMCGGCHSKWSNGAAATFRRPFNP